MKLSFQNRIAFSFMLATAGMVALVFLVIYGIVHTTVYHHLDANLTYEAEVHTREVQFGEAGLTFINKREWEEREHRVVDIHPVFIQWVNPQGRIMDKSPNLKEGALAFQPQTPATRHFTTEFLGSSIRQVQVPIQQAGTKRGYLLAAISFEDAQLVLDNLKQILLISFPLILLGLFGVTRFLAGQSIRPVQHITQTADRITRNRLNERMTLPTHKDELYTLTASINELLDRLELAIRREQQFTADASHELRTPLSVLQGTFEVLLRKTRSPEEYQEKIQLGIQEIDRLSHIVDQLLLLARFDRQTRELQFQSVSLVEMLHEALSHQQQDITTKSLRVQLDVQEEGWVQADPYLLGLVLDNLLNNAIKYSPANSELHLWLNRNEQGHLLLHLQDQGIGIREEDLADIFQPFFRSEALSHTHIRGQGLGLSIVQKICTLLQISPQVSSEAGKGTLFTLRFPQVSPTEPAISHLPGIMSP